MNADRRVRAELLYREAMECEPARRDAFLDVACQGDDDLRFEIESLLRESESPTATGQLVGVAALTSSGSSSADNRTVNQFEILEKIGEGGMGRVYKARDRRLDRLVALKFLAPALLESENAHARFLREAHALSSLSHPNIATIYDVAEAAGEPFLVLEYLSGGTLRTKVRRLAAETRHLSPAQVIRYATQIAEGLAHAHRSGIVHRDVKTSNILLDGEGNLKITDFGLARLQGQAAITGPRHAMGTAEYMSPEQAQGREVDTRSDIFSLGVVLYEVASGELPFRSDHPQATIYQILNATPRPLRELNADVPEELERIIGRCLQKNPEQRYQRLEDMLADLAAVQREVSTETGDASLTPTATLGPQRPKRKLPVAWLAALVVLSVLGIVPAVRNSIRSVLPHTTPAKEHLAVIPFAIVGGDQQAQAFGDGVVESLTSSLSQLEQFQGSLLVVPASELRRQPNLSVRDAQRSFGIDYAITGSVQRSGNQVRLTANLVDARSLRQRGARTLDVPLQNLAGMEDRLLGVVAELLEIQVDQQERSKVLAGRTSVSEASDAYLQGRGFLRRFDKTGNLEQAVNDFQRATKLDSHYALAYTGLSEAYLWTFQRKKDPQWLPMARDAASRAVELNAMLPASHVSLGSIYAATGEYKKAADEYRRALELDRLSVDAYRGLGMAYESLNQLGDAERTYRTAIDLRPDDWLSNGMLAAFYYRHARYAEAERYFKRITELTPDNFNGHSNLGVIYIVLDRHAEAEKELRQSIAIKPTDRAYTNLGSLYYQLGRIDEAVPMYEKAVELGGSANWVTLGNLADCYRRLPNLRSKATDSYRRAIAAADRMLALNPNDVDVLKSMAFYRAVSDDKEGALRDIAEARRLAPKDATVGFKSVLVYEKVGRRKQALAALEQILKGGFAIGQVEREPDLAPLRQDPAYARMKSRYPGNTTANSAAK